MFVKNYDIFLCLFGLCLCTIFSNASEECDRRSCPGPSYYYEEIGCKPIFENTTSCCPTSYNCDHWTNLRFNECWVEGHVYTDSQPIPSGSTSDPCLSCFCSGSDRLSCVIPRCAGVANKKPGCRYDLSFLSCCTQHEICEDSPVVCRVNGTSYKEGETFIPVDEPNKTCYCLEGYDGVNDERFCVWRKPSWCQNVIQSIDKIRNNCVPIYGTSAALHKDCNKGHICHENGRSYRIEKKPYDATTSTGTLESVDPTKQCKFGNFTMDIGDRLRSPQPWEAPVNCVCEVPPILTCLELPRRID